MTVSAGGIQSRRERYAGGIRSPPTQRGDMPVLIDALKSGDHDNSSLLEILGDTFVIDRFYPRLVVGTVGSNLDLATGIRSRRIAALYQCHREQRDRNLLSRGQQYIQFTTTGLWVHFFGQFDQAIGFATHRRHDDDHVMALVTVGNDFFRNCQPSLRRRHGGRHQGRQSSRLQ